VPIPFPPTESQRLAALCDLKILDSAQDPFFDTIAGLTRTLTNAPIAAVSLVEAERQWFKAIKGLDVHETPRSESFCAFAILGTEVLTVPDAHADARFCDNPLVTGPPFIRSYAGAPMITRDGHALGALAAIGDTPRIWTAEQCAGLAQLAELAVRHMESLGLEPRLHEIEVRHASVFGAMADGVVVQGPDGRITLANPAAEFILGLTLDQMCGRTSMDPGWQAVRADGSPFPGEEHPAMLALRTGKAVSGVIMGISRPNHERRWIKINARPILDLQGRTQEVVTTFSDVTAERFAAERLEQKQRRLELALDVGQIGVVEIDFGARTFDRFGHQPALDVFGPLDMSAPTPLLAKIAPSRQTDVAQLWFEHLKGGPRLRLEVPIGDDPSSNKWALIGAEQFGRGAGAVVAIKDISSRKQAEVALTEANLRLEAALRSKDNFLANMSHEIRTPLNGVMGMASTLAGTNLTANQREMVQVICSSSDILNRLLTDVLDMSKLEAGKFALEPGPFDLIEAVQGSAHLFAMKAADKGLNFATEFTPAAQGIWLGDRVRIQQITGNLVSNAIKFTDSGSVILRLSATGSPGTHALDWITLEIDDTGIGIPQEAQGRLFERFEQVDTGRSHDGTGLGLSICRGLVELMGGEISVQSEPNIGSLFTVRLPMTRVQPVLVAAPAADIKEVKLLRVLLADDHPTNQKVVEAMLRAFSCEVTTTSDGAGAVAAAKQSRFDLVLMDMAMPVMDGLEATRQIRAWEAQTSDKRTPIAMLTAYGSDQHKADGRQAGADFHIVKPVTPMSLLAGVEHAMRVARG
jgi:two-component system, sensor histidine kinase